VTPALNSSSQGSFVVQVDLNAPPQTQPIISSFLTNVVVGLVGALTNIVTGALSLLGLGGLTATQLTTVPGYAPQTKYQTEGSVSNPSGYALYRLQSAPAPAGQSVVMTVTVMAQDGTTLNPQVQVLDANLHAVNATVLANANGVLVLQVANGAPNAPYYLQVGAAQRPNKINTGLYFLDVNFLQPAAPASQPVTSNTLTSAAPQNVTDLTVTQNAVFSFTLSASTGGSTQAAEVQMQIVDANGHVVFTLIAYAGQQATTGTVYLQSGKYKTVFTAVPKTPGRLPPLSYTLAAMVLTNPQGPTATDTTTDTSTTPTYDSSSSTDTSSTYYTSTDNSTYYPYGASYTYS
jgi:hypothetical protein